MTEASMPRGEAAGTIGSGTTESGAARQPRRRAVDMACLVAGALALAVPLLWLTGPERSFADTLAMAAWAWVLLGVPLMAVLVIGGLRAARRGHEPRLVGVARWFAIGLAMGVVLLEAPRLVF